MTRKLKLGAFYNPTGHHVASWRHPDAQADAGVNFRHYTEIARTAERAAFHLVFLADNVATRTGNPDVISRSAQYIANFEPTTLLSALAAVTERIGLVATASTSFYEPYHVARKFASIDHISGGRAAWNIVTSAGGDAEAQNFNRERHIEHEARYDRAEEFVQVVKGLWDSWDDDAFIRDKQSGVFSDLSKMHALNHRGPHFQVKGPLNVPRPPQGWPVLVQAGSSPTGRDFAARHAEIVFAGSHSLESNREHYADMRARAERHGRNPDHLVVLPGMAPIVGRTAEEAEEKHQYLQSLITPEIGRELLSMQLGGVDLTPYDIDGPLPQDLPMSNNSQGGFVQIMKTAREENLTIRQLYMRQSSARGQKVFKGTASQIADEMEHWVTSEACDGFNVMPTHLPGGLDEFVDLVVPELRRRGLFRSEYEGRTLRENLGLPRPESRYA